MPIVTFLLYNVAFLCKLVIDCHQVTMDLFAALGITKLYHLSLSLLDSTRIALHLCFNFVIVHHLFRGCFIMNA